MSCCSVGIQFGACIEFEYQSSNTIIFVCRLIANCLSNSVRMASHFLIEYYRLTEELGPGWRTVPANDPVVKDAANHALKIIHGMSNSLFPYELLDILQARAEVWNLLSIFGLPAAFKLLHM